MKESKKEDSEEDPKEKSKEKGKFPFDKFKKSKASLPEKISHMLNVKIEAHNEKFEQKLTFAQLNKVYSRGLNVFNTTHKPGISLHQWAVARVNLFLKMMTGGQVRHEYSLLDSDVANASSGVITESGLASYDFINFSDLEFQLAKISFWMKINLVKNILLWQFMELMREMEAIILILNISLTIGNFSGIS